MIAGALLRRPISDSTIDGKAVSLYTLKNANGMAAQITNYGGIIVDVWVPAKDGAFKDVVPGYPKLADYFAPENTFAGAITGRYANRIANGKFTLDGKEYSLAINNGPNTLHGGIVGFSKKVWDARTFTNDAGEAGARTDLCFSGRRREFSGYADYESGLYRDRG